MYYALCCFKKQTFNCWIVTVIVAVSPPVFQMRTMSDEAEQRMCDEDFGSDEEGEEGDVESYLEDNSSELVDRLRELEVSEKTKHTLHDKLN